MCITQPASRPNGVGPSDPPSPTGSGDKQQVPCDNEGQVPALPVWRQGEQVLSHRRDLGGRGAKEQQGEKEKERQERSGCLDSPQGLAGDWGHIWGKGGWGFAELGVGTGNGLCWEGTDRVNTPLGFFLRILIPLQ